MAENFKTCMFGGFDRQNVVNYIEKQSRENREKIEALEAELAVRTAENDALRSKNEDLTGELGILREITCETKQTKEENQKLCQEMEELRKRMAALEAENETCRAEHEDYQVLKNHIAEIEIQARRNAETFRAEAIAKLKETIERQRAWNDKTRDAYMKMNDALRQQLRDSENALSGADFSSFAQMSQELQDLEDSFNQ